MRVIFVVMKTTFRVEPITSYLLIRSSHAWFHILVVIYSLLDGFLMNQNMTSSQLACKLSW